jgi:hypothetical protein
MIQNRLVLFLIIGWLLFLLVLVLLLLKWSQLLIVVRRGCGQILPAVGEVGDRTDAASQLTMFLGESALEDDDGDHGGQNDD